MSQSGSELERENQGYIVTRAFAIVSRLSLHSITYSVTYVWERSLRHPTRRQCNPKPSAHHKGTIYKPTRLRPARQKACRGRRGPLPSNPQEAKLMRGSNEDLARCRDKTKRYISAAQPLQPARRRALFFCFSFLFSSFIEKETVLEEADWASHLAAFRSSVQHLFSNRGTGCYIEAVEPGEG